MGASNLSAPDDASETSDAAVIPSSDSGRSSARWSIILMHGCFVTAFLGNLAEQKWGAHGLGAWNGYAQSFSFALLVMAFLLGVSGISRGLRDRNWETVVIAAIGLFLATATLATIACVAWRMAHLPPVAFVLCR